MLERFREYVKTDQFNAVRIGIASPDKIRSLSYGEVKKMETINYRTLKPERDGLFCARIFGPQKDWECTCGKYKRMKHRGVVCEKCGTEVIESRVRRERMGHIELVAPVVHTWYLKGIPSYLGLVLDMSVRDLERVIYFDAYLVLQQGNSPYPPKTLLSIQDYEKYVEHHPEDTTFHADMGADAIKEILTAMDTQLEIEKLQKEYAKTSSTAARHKIMRRIKVFNGFVQGDLKPEWMVLEALPVLPPDIRPLVPLEGGRFASSDLNELYRRVLNRNIRLQRLKEIQAPTVIIKNEQRMLQESVDALIDNGRRGQPVRGTSKRPLKSLSEMLRGKQGRFRQNLLGKRVDYSGRSVIVVDPELRLDQCGIPKLMALELFKSHVYAELLQREEAPNLRTAKKMVEHGDPEIWGALEAVVSAYPVLLNRAPTLHRLGIQAFYPILVDGKAITIHPLVCAPFNADFDGDQMAVHVPLSQRAKKESTYLMLSAVNLLSPANGRPVLGPTLEMVLGLHYLTKARANCPYEYTVFSSPAEVISAYKTGTLMLHAQIKVRVDGVIHETTVGRVVMYTALPQGSEFHWVNKVLRKKDMTKLVERVYHQFGPSATVEMLDHIKKLGFYYSTMGGLSAPITSLTIPAKKQQLVQQAEKQVKKIDDQYVSGKITNAERYNQVINIWAQTTDDVADEMIATFEEENERAYRNEDQTFEDFNPIFLAMTAGAKGGTTQIKQLVGMRGLMAKPSGDIMETPVKANFKEGLSVFEYFISTHGARKGQADTALKTANSGYLTRRLIDVAQDVVVSMRECNSLGHIILDDLQDSGEVISHLADRAYGRIAATDIKDPISGEMLIEQGRLIDREDVRRLKDSAVSQIAVRSAMQCQAKRGICAHCYGMDLSTGAIVAVGTTVGIIAAQSIGEPGTQLTMRTFHIGGTASLSEQSSYTAKHNGTVYLRGVRTVTLQDNTVRILSRKAKLVITSPDGRELQRHDLEYGSQLHVEDGQSVTIGTVLVEWDNNNKVLLTEEEGYVRYDDLIPNMTMREQYDETTGKTTKLVMEHKSDKYQPALTILGEHKEEKGQYYLPSSSYLLVDQGAYVQPGDILVKIPRGSSRAHDITGGLPRIAELFEARMPKDPAILADIDGEVVYGGLHRGLRRISVVSGDESYDYFVPRHKQMTVGNGDFVQAGDALTSGEPALHDILRISGPDMLQQYLVDQIQAIYRLQGIDINDRHIEVIVRQMLRKVRIIEPGDTEFLIGDRVDKVQLQMMNSALKAEGKRPATARPVLMGITLASLGTESFISAASFQETTRILAEAAIMGQVDYLYGLKENVIIGKLIPAGTGVPSYRERYLTDTRKTS